MNDDATESDLNPFNHFTRFGKKGRGQQFFVGDNAL